MSAMALQRVVVRMLFDSALVDALYAGDLHALADLPLTTEERSWLTRPDRRAWGADPWRRARALTGLLAEFPASAALACASDPDASALDAYFSSAIFHFAIQSRLSLAQGFADWLCTRSSSVASWLHAVVRIEAAQAGCARATQRYGPVDRPQQPSIAFSDPQREHFSLHPAVRVVLVPVGTLALRARILTALQSHPNGPTAALIEGPISSFLASVANSRDHETPAEQEAWILSGREGEVAVEGGSEALAKLLHLALEPVSGQTLVAALAHEGLQPAEAQEVLVELVDDGLLRMEGS